MGPVDDPAAERERRDVTERAVVRVGVRVDLDVHLGGAEGPLPYLARDELPALERELPELAPERIEWGTRIDQRRHDHVARRPTRTVEIGDFHTRDRRRPGPPAGRRGGERESVPPPRTPGGRA